MNVFIASATVAALLAGFAAAADYGFYLDNDAGWFAKRIGLSPSLHEMNVNAETLQGAFHECRTAGVDVDLWIRFHAIVNHLCGQASKIMTLRGPPDDAIRAASRFATLWTNLEEIEPLRRLLSLYAGSLRRALFSASTPPVDDLIKIRVAFQTQKLGVLRDLDQITDPDLLASMMYSSADRLQAEYGGEAISDEARALDRALHFLSGIVALISDRLNVPTTTALLGVAWHVLTDKDKGAVIPAAVNEVLTAADMVPAMFKRGSVFLTPFHVEVQLLAAAMDESSALRAIGTEAYKASSTVVSQDPNLVANLLLIDVQARVSNNSWLQKSNSVGHYLTVLRQKCLGKRSDGLAMAVAYLWRQNAVYAEQIAAECRRQPDRALNALTSKPLALPVPLIDSSAANDKVAFMLQKVALGQTTNPNHVISQLCSKLKFDLHPAPE